MNERKSKRKRSARAERGVACHEAGHAVMAVLVRWRWRSLSIVPDKGTEGRMLFDSLPPSMMNALVNPTAKVTPALKGVVKRFMKTLMAGTVAAEILIGRPGRGGDDQVAVGIWSNYVTGGSAKAQGAYTCRVRAEVKQQLQQPRVLAAVKAVVAALLEKRCLGRKEVRAIVKRHFREVGR